LGSLETVIYRNLSFNLSDGSVVDAQLTVPAATNGTFPGVLLIQDSGAMDMDEYHPAQVAGSNRSSRPFRQIAEYLSKRGFAVLRYNKRGVGLGGAVTNSSVLERAQFEDLRDDAERAFSLLSIQPEVDKNDLTLIGHGEGTAIASEIAATNSSVKQMVLLSPFALNLTEMMYFQIVIRPTAYAEEAVDVNHDGFLSVEEVEATVGSEAEPTRPSRHQA
jgi:pimeloyl-ACP methyl ester carboxylesterase